MSRPAVAVDYDPDGICQAEFRKAMSNFPTGVAVLTAAENGTRYGMTVNSLTSVSLTPSLLLVCPKKGSSTGEALKRTGRFAVTFCRRIRRICASASLVNMRPALRDWRRLRNAMRCPCCQTVSYISSAKFMPFILPATTTLSLAE